MPIVKRHKRFQGFAEPAVLSRELDAGLVERESEPWCSARHFTVGKAIVVPLRIILFAGCR